MAEGGCGGERLLTEHCSGSRYNFELEEDGGELEEKDILGEKDGGRVVVDKISLEYIQGSTLD